MRKIAIIAALPGELKPLVRNWQRRERNLWAGRIGERDAVAIAGGIGAAAAGRAVERVFTEANLDVVVSYGWAGALTCAVKPRTACAISEVIDAGTGEHFVTNYPGGYRLITLDHVARADEKRGLAERYQSVLADMEAATVARMAAARRSLFIASREFRTGTMTSFLTSAASSIAKASFAWRLFLLMLPCIRNTGLRCNGSVRTAARQRPQWPV